MIKLLLATLFVMIASVSALAQSFDDTGVSTGRLGQFANPQQAGIDLKATYPGYFDAWGFNAARGLEVVNVNSLYPGNGNALHVPQPNASCFIKLGPLAGGTFLFNMLYSNAFPSQNPSYGLCEVKVYNASSVQVGTVQTFQVGPPNHLSLPTTLLCIVTESVPYGGYVELSGQTGSFYLDNLSGGGGPIPVELTSFSARYVRDNVELKWITATELNNYGFAIERSVDGKSWTEVDFVPGAGNSFSPRGYSWTDQLDDDLRRNETLAYRLLQMDRDGTTEYSNIVYVNLGPAPSAVQLHEAYPNPFNPATTVSFTLPVAAVASVSVHNVYGQEVVTLLDNAAFDAGVHTVSFNGDKLPSGSYIVVLRAGDVVRHQRIVLSK